MVIKPVAIEDVQPTHVDGAHVYITNAKHEKIIFVGAIEDMSLIDLRGLVILLKSKYIKQVFFACKVYFNHLQAEGLKKEVVLFRSYKDNQSLDQDCLHALDILETAADIVLKDTDKCIYIIGD